MANLFEGYYLCVSKVDQAVRSPDDSHRRIPGGALVYYNQATSIPKSKTYIKYSGTSVDAWRKKNPQGCICGGPHNNMKGVYIPPEEQKKKDKDMVKELEKEIQANQEKSKKSESKK